LAGGAPLVMLIERQGWRNSLLLLGLTGTGILLINLWGLPKVSLTPAVLRNRPTLFTDLIKIFKNTQVWLFGIVAVGIYLSISVVADLWGVSFVMEKFSIEKSQAAQMISLIYIGTTLGCILFPWIARETQSIRYPLFAGSAGVICLLSSLIYLPELSLGTGKMIFLGIGVFTGSEILCFIGACRLMEPDLIGTMSGFLNCIITLVGAIVQQNVGIVLDYFWDGKLTLDGIPHYSIYTYQVAFGVILFLTFISVFLSCFIKPYPMPLPHQN
jgi:fucose permease